MKTEQAEDQQAEKRKRRRHNHAEIEALQAEVARLKVQLAESGTKEEWIAAIDAGVAAQLFESPRAHPWRNLWRWMVNRGY